MPTDIEWTDDTWNPIGGCSVRSPGCKPCYAMKLAGTRLKHHPLYAGTTSNASGRPVFNGRLTVLPDDHPAWQWPVRYKGASHPKLGPGMPSLIFVGDMSDLHHENRVRAVQDKVVESVVYSKHIGQLLTKRPHVMHDHIASLVHGERWRRELQDPIVRESTFPPWLGFDDCIVPRLWLGMSAERQQEFDERWPYLKLLARLGFIVFVSYEPALGPLVLPDDFLALGQRAWVIAGGVSGHWPWAPHPIWFEQLQVQCARAGVPFFMKQWGEWAPHQVVPGGDLGGDVRRGRVTIVHPTGETDNEVFRRTGGRNTIPGSRYMIRAGKKKSGHQLRGNEYREFPRIAA